MAEPEDFKHAYGKLNKEQKLAVDTVEGPVLVIAGPGTGKTHILTLRIANILDKTQADPSSILVLTFTDSAARNVRKRLAGLIGEETARKVGTYTFHSFADAMMKEYPESFAEYSESRLMGEVENVLLWRDVLEAGKAKLLVTPKSPFHYLNDLKHLEDEMTRERLSIADYHAWLDTEEERLTSDPALRYVRGEKEGELKPEGLKKIERLEKGREAARLIEAYRKEKDDRRLYGYTDVLRITVDTIAENDALRAELQERYQYVLADEHQDANALQHALLDGLAFDEHPNLFIVGDEKQAIFGFQGADTTHFKTFLTLYPRTTIIPLTENYRSYQEILDLSHTLLKDLPSSQGEHAKLLASRGGGAKAHLLAAPDPLSERDQVASLIEGALAEGVEPHEIAVITMKNSTADLFALALRARGIPTLRAGNVDLEGRPAIRALLALMQAVADSTDISSLRQALLAPWWSPGIRERALLLRQFRDYELRDALETTFPKLSETLNELVEQTLAMPPVSLFSQLLSATGARDYFLSTPDALAEDIPLVRQLTLYIEELSRRSPNSTFAEIMEDFRKAREHEVGSIKTTLTQKEGMVTVITAHKAKGMEFKRVFVSSLTQGEWESRGKAALIPSPFDSTREKEEVIRLFYVALTRAKDELVLSYPVAGSEGKEISPLSLLPSGLPQLTPSSDPLPLLHSTYETSKLVCELTERYLIQDGLSPSAYNEYLKSPPTFFARRVLRLSEPETRAIVVGNAVHAAIANYLEGKELSEKERIAAAEKELTRALGTSLLPRGDTFDELSRHARASFTAYVENAPEQETVAIEESFDHSVTVRGKQIRLKGKVDAVFKTDEGECIVDFKTSSTLDGKKEEYERQLAFYDMLLRQNGHTTTSAKIVQVGEEGIREKPVDLTAETRAELTATLNEVLEELLTCEWRASTEISDYDAILKQFD